MSWWSKKPETTRLSLEAALDLFYTLDPVAKPDLAHLRNVLGKDYVDSVEDIRKITMVLDRQTYQTPVIVRFSESDIVFGPVNGVECAIDKHDHSVSAPTIGSGVYEAHLIPWFNRLCLPGNTVLDIGANVGFHATLLAKRVGPDGHVYAFEPNSENCRLILLNAEKNRLTNLTLLPIALSEERGWAYFSSHVGSNGGFVSDQFVALHGHGSVVPTFTLDELSLPEADFIKIDVEGAEYRALSGGPEYLKRSRPSIICEFSVEMVQRVSGVAPQDFLEGIVTHDYELYILERTGPAVATPVPSVTGLMESWGDLGRIEDLLFLPKEKKGLMA